MSHFYGTLQGARGPATRCGSRSSGVRVQAAGWGGAVETYVYEEDGIDMFVVRMIPWHGSGGQRQVLAKGELKSTMNFKTFAKSVPDEVPPPRSDHV